MACSREPNVVTIGDKKKRVVVESVALNSSMFSGLGEFDPCDNHTPGHRTLGREQRNPTAPGSGHRCAMADSGRPSSASAWETDDTGRPTTPVGAAGTAPKDGSLRRIMNPLDDPFPRPNRLALCYHLHGYYATLLNHGPTFRINNPHSHVNATAAQALQRCAFPTLGTAGTSPCHPVGFFCSSASRAAPVPLASLPPAAPHD